MTVYALSNFAPRLDIERGTKSASPEMAIPGNYLLFGGLLPLPPPEGLPVVLGQLPPFPLPPLPLLPPLPPPLLPPPRFAKTMVAIMTTVSF